MTRGRSGRRGRSGAGGLVPALIYPALFDVLGLGAAVGLGLLPGVSPPFSPWVFAVEVGFLSGVGALLGLGRTRDERVRALALVLLVTASSFAYRPLAFLAALLPGAEARALGLLLALPPDAFLPAAVWLFVRDFPHTLPLPWGRRISAAALGASLAAGVALLGATLSLELLGDAAPALARRFARSDPISQYWTLSYGLLLPALPFALWRARHARVEERRRVTWFLAGLLAAGIPVAAIVIGGALSPGFAALLRSERGRMAIVPLAQALVLSIPLTTAYAVMVQRVLDVRVVIRKALQYGLARVTVALAVALPFGFAAARLFAERERPLAELPKSGDGAAIGAALLLGAAALRFRGRAIAALDRLFFREQADARRVLSELVARARDSASAGELTALLAQELDRALHLRACSVLVADEASGELRDPAGGRALPLRGDLAALLAAARGPLPVALEPASPAVEALPLDDRQWIADGGFELLAPLLSSAGALIGAIALGEKKSELAFSREDRLLLSAISASAALTLEARLARDSLAGGSDARDRPARECPRCAAVAEADEPQCTACRGALVESAIPGLVAGKFRLERRIGSGGMGVVYRARDVALQRDVAIKALPRTSPEGSARLRREARVMAAVQHPNLALIFGAESWRSTPILVVEYLDGGTLADRIARTPLGAAETLELGVVLADVLARIHAAGILHRDVKPSNIGYTRDGVAKLLDFGLAQIVQKSVYGGDRSLDEGRAIAERDLAGAGDSLGAASTLVSEGVAGTPLYMSPEALWGATPDPSFDLWGAALVMVEALAGAHPLRRGTWAATLDAITRAELADPRELAPDCPPPLAECLAGALHRDPGRRPQSAREFGARLRAARAPSAGAA